MANADHVAADHTIIVMIDCGNFAMALPERESTGASTWRDAGRCSHQAASAALHTQVATYRRTIACC